MRVRLDARFSLLTVAYVAVIGTLSSIPDLSPSEETPLVLLLYNLAHVPLFAGLAFCVFKSLSVVGASSSAQYALAFMACTACAALDEWHQSFVPGRTCSLGDFLLDLAGIGAMLVLLHLCSAVSDRRSPARARMCWLRHP
jgi:VanZ family protein